MIKIYHTDDVMMYIFYNSITKQDINILREEIKCLLDKSDEWIDGWMYGKKFKINRNTTDNIYSIPLNDVDKQCKARIPSFVDPLKKVKFGKYKGQTIGYVCTNDREYYEWYIKQLNK